MKNLKRIQKIWWTLYNSSSENSNYLSIMIIKKIKNDFEDSRGAIRDILSQRKN